jgi:tryptophanyl-tRNA synthetase
MSHSLLRKTAKFYVFCAPGEVIPGPSTPPRKSDTLTPASRPTKTPKSLNKEMDKVDEELESLPLSMEKAFKAEFGDDVPNADAAVPTTASSSSAKEQVVDPWTVESDGAIDYDKLIDQFGSQRLGKDLVERIERVTGRKPHRFLRRGFFFSHRDLTQMLDLHEAGKKFYLYTGRGPSSEALHMGHLIPFHFTKWLQDAFDCPLVIQLTDDEKFLFKQELKLEECHR